MALLTSVETLIELGTARQERRTISDECAQTIASWWYAPRDPGLVALATAGTFRHEIFDEIDAQLEALPATGTSLGELDALREWALSQL